MCGIFGYVTGKPNNGKFKAIMQQGLWADTFRGMCGTGVYGSKIGGKPYTFKRALEGPDFVRSRQFEEFGKKMYDFNVVIGHNRAATIGLGEDENCHPFQFDHIGFVHNGTLRDYMRLVKDKTFNHSVDSAWAAKALAEHENPVDVLSRVLGPYVFVWHNSNTNTFHIARNSNRDIWWINDKEGEHLFYASEWGLLQWILDRNGVDIGRNLYKSPKEHTMLTWDLTKPVSVGPKVTKYEEVKPEVVYPAWQNRSEQWQGGGGRSNFRNAEFDQLNDWEISYGDEVLVKIEGFYKYSGYADGYANAPGFLQGRIVEPGSKADGVAVRIHRITPSESAAYLEDGWAEATVSGVTIGLKNPVNDKVEPWLNANHATLPRRNLPAIVGEVAKGADKAGNKGNKKEQPAAKAVQPSKDAAAVEADTTGGDPVVEEMFLGPKGVFLTLAEFREEVRSGCIYCGDPISERLARDVEWISWTGNEDCPLCPACQKPEVYTELGLTQASYGGRRH
jgi:hypothetical protein